MPAMTFATSSVFSSPISHRTHGADGAPVKPRSYPLGAHGTLA